jgi:putative PIG3 family NAD(P)H quinone oxidoreductase
MRAVVIREPGGPEVLELRDVATPVPAHDEARVRVHATAVNRADILQRLGRYAVPSGVSAVPGLEIAGVVDAVGEHAADLKPGDRVFGLVAGGGYAEYVTAPARTLARLDASVATDRAAAIPEASITAWDALFDQAGLQPGETLLVHAAGSGVGTAAVQLGRWIGALVIGTSRSEAKLARAAPLGLDHGVLVENGRFAEAVLAKTGRAGADVVFDLVGGSYLEETMACLGARGRVVVAGAMGGSRATLDVGMLLEKRAILRGTMLRSRGLEERILLGRTLGQRIQGLVLRGAVRPVVDRVLPLAEAAEAHRIVQSNSTFGKVVLTTV